MREKCGRIKNAVGRCKSCIFLIGFVILYDIIFISNLGFPFARDSKQSGLIANRQKIIHANIHHRKTFLINSTHKIHWNSHIICWWNKNPRKAVHISFRKHEWERIDIHNQQIQLKLAECKLILRFLTSNASSQLQIEWGFHFSIFINFTVKSPFSTIASCRFASDLVLI
jgi:hypothetical protein